MVTHRAPREAWLMREEMGGAESAPMMSCPDQETVQVMKPLTKRGHTCSH